MRVDLGFGGMRDAETRRGTFIYDLDPDAPPVYYKERPEVQLPLPWNAWCMLDGVLEHDPDNLGGWAEPELRITTHPDRTPPDALQMFTFWRAHDAGVFRQINVDPGDTVALEAEAHAWASTDDNPRTSDGVGSEKFFAPAGTIGVADNAIFQLGIDRRGGTDPRSPAVVWGTAAHIYNGYRAVPPVSVIAESSTVTVFLRQVFKWRLKHCDGYWRNAAVIVQPQIELPPGPSGPVPSPSSVGMPREQYRRTYVLMPPDADEGLVARVVKATWDKERFTVGGSADDAGIGALNHKRVLAVYPERWADDLADFFGLYYPGTVYVPVSGPNDDDTIAELIARAATW